VGSEIGSWAAGERYTFDNSESCTLVAEPGEEHGLKHYSKCQMLAFDGYNACPGGGVHISVDSHNYAMI
jgi:hypothetical protein